MTYLADPVAAIKPHYTVVVIGSGYGGAITASRLARAGQNVCLLERGREFQPGDYPNTLPQAEREMQVDAPLGHVGSRTALYDFRLNEDINVFMGCGLGGTSLVNANVSLRADPRVFDDERWPGEFQRDVSTRLEEGYGRAEEMLRPATYPDSAPPLPKLHAMERAARKLGERFSRVPLNVNFSHDGPNHVGVTQHACTLCGDCVSGCNYGAKNSLVMNYLPDARNHGAEIFTEVAVRWIERRDDRWLVHYQLVESGRERFHAPTLCVGADLVVLAAGSLGSTEILLRSRDAGLPMSGMVGRKFSGNGDVLAFGYNTREEIRGVGMGHRPPHDMDPVGPCISSVIDIRDTELLESGMVIEEGTIPGALGAIVPGTLAVLSALEGERTSDLFGDRLFEQQRLLASLAGPYHGAARHTQTYLVMSHDDGDGHMELVHDRLRIRWPAVGHQAIFSEIDQRLREVTRALGGTHLRNPAWSRLARHNVITVHALGGCVMAEDAERGVVNHRGQVFSGGRGAEVYQNLYVSDAAVIPRSLGVNPLLTISALAERCAALMASDRGWTIDYTLPSAPRSPSRARRIGLQFTETMRGYFSTKVVDDFTRAAEQGERDASRFEFTLTVVLDDLDHTLSDSQHPGRVLGTVTAPALSPEPLTVTHGVFNLFVADPKHARAAEKMRYRMRLTAVDGATYYLDGFKRIRHKRGFDLWSDTTTLFITVHRGENDDGPVLGKGILRIRPDDFLRQLSTIEARGGEGAAARLAATARFGGFFAGELFHTYGGILARVASAFDPRRPAPPLRERRPLRLGAPEIHEFQTRDEKEKDRVMLRLTRYRGGERGPVILAPGFGTSTVAFTIDTTETNFPEYLYAHGYDVWLFDYRGSPSLPASGGQFSLDEIARFDWPAAVDTVRETTGAQNTQVVGHCVGSLSFLMATLAGMKGVRSAVCSQLTTHPDAPLLTVEKAWTRLGDLLFLSGRRLLSTSLGNAWIERAFDKFMLAYPSWEQCDSPVCRRILFWYGEVFKHERLNRATHEAIHEMFGRANLTTLLHMTRMIRKGHVVDQRGRDVYLPRIERLAMPVSFIHGERNTMFVPSGSQKAYDLLCRKNGQRLYSRRVIQGYGHMDCFIGRDAAKDVYPVILEELEKWN